MAQESLPDVILDEELESEILDWLYTEIENARLAREPVAKRWAEIDEWYDKQELEGKKNYPFEGAAHLMIGIMPTFCETIKAKVMNTIFAPSDPFSVKHYNPDWADFVKPMRRFMTWASDNEIQLEAALDPFILEMLKKGSAVSKIIYTKEVESRFEYVEGVEGDAPVLNEIPEITKDQPEYIHIQLPDFFYQMHARSLEESEWKAHRFRLSKFALEAKETNGEFKDVKRIFNWEEKQKTIEERDAMEPGVDPEPIDMTEFEIYEVWFRHPIKRGGRPVKMQWFIHLEARVALRKRYNWFPLQLDPFDMMGYESREHKVYSRGVGEIALPFQKEISTMHNQRLDSVTVRNAPVFKRKADSMLPDFIVFRPGGVIPVQEMDEIETLFTGQQYDSTISDETHSLAMLRERLGLEDFAQDGNLQQATAALAVMAERGRRFDHFIKRFRLYLSSVMTKIMLLYQKYYPEGRALQVLGEDGMFVELILQFPPEPISKGIGIDVTATTASTSRELDRQNKLALFNLITQYYGQLTQYAIQAQNPQLPEPVRLAMLSIIDALSAFVEDILEDFNLTHSREIAGVIETARQAAIASGGQPGQPQAANGAPGVAPVPGAPAGGQITAGV